ncbi:MAG: DUF167 domain-containing protein [Nitrososphaerota archaeon]|jgi:uncharacterized protein (TIGR00251 family)|nr:DUF167 domain-containing protein [Nitrososphaerota archaeon]
MSIKETVDGVLITIFVKPNSSKFSIEFDDKDIVIYATEEPEKGKVNKEILRELTKLFHTKVELVSGATSRQKQLAIGVNRETLEQVLKKK